MGDHSFGGRCCLPCLWSGIDVFTSYTDEDTLYLGRKLTSGKECYHLYRDDGRYGEAAEGSKLMIHERAAFFMPSGNARVGLANYHRFHRLVLDNLGFQQCTIYSLIKDETLYTDLGHHRGPASHVGWQGLWLLTS